MQARSGNQPEQKMYQLEESHYMKSNETDKKIPEFGR